MVTHMLLKKTRHEKGNKKLENQKRTMSFMEQK